MSRYRRAQVPGATYFFTVNLLNRRSDLLVRHIDLLRETVRATRLRHPFHIDAWVVLPDHMHCVWTLPDGDAGFALRWKVIKLAFARRLPKTEVLTATQRSRGERGIWQRRYWEHLIQDERDYRHHVDYVHRNPLKHGLVERVVDWPYSSFHRAVGAGIYPVDWCGDVGGGIRKECGLTRGKGFAVFHPTPQQRRCVGGVSG